MTLTEWGTTKGCSLQNGTPLNSENNSDYLVVNTSTDTKQAVLNITRPHDDVHLKMAEEERKNLKIGVKIFINEDSTSQLKECLENGKEFLVYVSVIISHGT